MKILMLANILLASVSCADHAASPSSQVKHLLLTEGMDKEFYQENSDLFLITHIFESEWEIAYYVQPQCNFDDAQLQQIKAAIGGSIKRWLQWLTGTGRKVPVGHPPGHEDSTVVDELMYVNVTDDYVLKDVSLNFDGKEAKRRQGIAIKKNLLTVFFYCGTVSPATGGQRSAYYHPKWIDRGDDTWFLEATIHMFISELSPKSSPSQAGSGSDSCWFDIGNTGFNRFTLLHEMGHAMGLADTYFREGYNDEYEKELRTKLELPPRTDDDPDRLMDEHRPGSYQPPSIMSCDLQDSNKPIGRDKTPRLSFDDILGIISAYETLVLEKQN